MYGSFIDDWKTPDEYISRKAVYEMLENAQIISEGENSGYCTEDISISSIPAADVVPVVYGEWIFHEEYGQLVTHKCSICGQTMTTTGNLMYYFPNCGAKMGRGKQP